MRISKSFFVLLGISTLLMLLSCAYKSQISEKEERFSLIDPKESILASNKYYVLSEAGICEAMSTGRQDVDKIISNQSKFQDEVADYFKSKKGGSVEIIKVSRAETKQKIQEVLKAEGRDNFYQPFGKDIDFYFYTKVMAKVAEKYGASLIVPRVIVKQIDAYAGEKTGFFSRGDLVFDGVKRRVETTGSFLQRLAGRSGEGSYTSGVFGLIDVVSLQVEIYSSQKLQFWSRGGYDNLQLLSTAGIKKNIKDKDLNEVFGEGKDAKENLKECVAIALSPLFGEYKK